MKRTGTAARLSAHARKRLGNGTLRLWVGGHTFAWNDAVPRDVRNRLLMTLGGGIFTWCMTIKLRTGKSLRLNDWSEAQIKAMIDAESHGSLSSKMCYTLSMLSHSMKRVRQLALQPSNVSSGKSKALWRGYHMLARAFRLLLQTRILVDMPNTPRVSEHDVALLRSLAGVLLKEFSVIEQASRSAAQSARARTLLARASGLGIFTGVREQSGGGAEIGVAGLVAWLARQLPRPQRGFFADIGCGIHELGAIAKELTTMRDRTSRNSNPWKALTHAIQVVEITIHQVLDTGVLMSVPV